MRRPVSHPAFAVPAFALSLCVALATAGCQHPQSAAPPDAAAGTGGAPAGTGGGGGSGTGGLTGSGGARATGGASGSGGGAAGGTSGSGGTSAIGGTSGSGGAPTDARLDTPGADAPAPDAAKIDAGPPPGLGSCTLPAGANATDIDSAYAKWKADLLTSDGAGGFLRVRRPNSGTINSSNSEGTAYGMEIAVYMNEQDVFDKLWKYEQLHLDSNGLMNWEITAEGNVSGTGAATDGDEDMAFALVMADRRWGGRGSLNDTYLNIAKKQIDLIWQYEVDRGRNNVLRPGDSFANDPVINISYFAPAYYRIFGQVTGKSSDWDKVASTSYDVIEATLTAANGNQQNGLVPAWSTPAGMPQSPQGNSQPTYHQLDSSRTPFRLAQDYCWFGTTRALTYLTKISGFYSSVGAANIVDGYNLNGTPNTTVSLHLAAFVGPAGVGAMATPQYATLRDQAYALIATPPGLLGGSLYYNESWTVLSLLMMNGRFLNLAAN